MLIVIDIKISIVNYHSIQLILHNFTGKVRIEINLET